MMDKVRLREQMEDIQWITVGGRHIPIGKEGTRHERRGKLQSEKDQLIKRNKEIWSKGFGVSDKTERRKLAEEEEKNKGRIAAIDKELEDISKE